MEPPTLDDVRRARTPLEGVVRPTPLLRHPLLDAETGLMPTDWKPMSTVGSGVVEIRLRGRLEHRVLYVAKFEEAVYVLHAFPKKTQRTRKADLELARSRLREVEGSRRSPKER